MKITRQALLVLTLLAQSGLIYAENNEEFRWRDVRASCVHDWNPEACLEQQEKAQAYCAQHSDKKRCRKLNALKDCKHDPNSELCEQHKEKFKVFCQKRPGVHKCVKARIYKICKDDPESQECVSAKENAHAKFCEKHPESERCS